MPEKIHVYTAHNTDTDILNYWLLPLATIFSIRVERERETGAGDSKNILKKKKKGYTVMNRSTEARSKVGSWY